jgi:uncharacterized protein YgiM (DUF1202 family)
MSVTVLEVVRGPAAQQLARQRFGYAPDSAKEQETVAIKVKLAVLSDSNAQAIQSLDLDRHIGYRYDDSQRWAYTPLVEPEPIQEGYAPIEGTGWLFLQTKADAPLPYLYFHPDLLTLQNLGIQHIGQYLSLEERVSSPVGPTPAAQDQAPAGNGGSTGTVLETANLRGGPGTGYTVLGILAKDTVVEITGRDKSPADWWQVVAPGGQQAWVSAQLVTASGADSVPTITAPYQKWVLVADSAAVFPGGGNRSTWHYLWSQGRNNFRWQDMAQQDPSACYRSPTGMRLEVCADTIKADAAGDLAVQWQAQKGGTYRFEWDSPALLFYKHLDPVGSQGPGTELQYSAVIKDVVDWEMYFWVAREDTPYHIRVFELQQ